MRRTNIYLDEPRLRALDELASAQGVSRAEVIRRLLDDGLSGGARASADDVAALMESSGALHEIPSPDRTPGARERHLETMRAR